jgi:predicted Zn-dependent protease
MKKLRLHPFVVLAGLTVFAVACSTVPFTNRSQLLLTSEAQEASLGAQAYQHALAEEPLIHDPALLAPMREVGQRIAAVADRPDYKWEFNLVDAPDTANASVLPGGKVIVYSGLYEVARDTGGLAAVLAHEVGHAIARHGGERMSQTAVMQMVGTGLSVAFESASPATQTGVMAAFGLGAQYGVMLPFSRSQESEADHIGVILMAKAGYDPQAAVELWERFAKMGGAAPPEFLSTHPNSSTRQVQIREWLPEARGYLPAGGPIAVKPLPKVR